MSELQTDLYLAVSFSSLYVSASVDSSWHHHHHHHRVGRKGTTDDFATWSWHTDDASLLETVRHCPTFLYIALHFLNICDCFLLHLLLHVSQNVFDRI